MSQSGCQTGNESNKTGSKVYVTLHCAIDSNISRFLSSSKAKQKHFKLK